MNRELPDAQAGFRKVRGMRDQLLRSTGSSRKQESSRKTSISALLTMPKPLTVWITVNCGKFWKRWKFWNQQEKASDFQNILSINFNEICTGSTYEKLQWNKSVS